MALTTDVIKSNEVLSGLTDEQITAITTLSVNDEQAVIDQKIGQTHGGYENDVFALTNVQKNQGEKAYAYALRVLGEYKAKADSYSANDDKIQQLTAEKTSLEQKLHENAGDVVVKQQLSDANNRLTQMQALIESEKTAYTAEKEKLENKIKNVHVDYAFENAVLDMKFKANIPESVKQVIIKNAKNEILEAYKPDYAAVNGTNTLVFRDKDGNIVANKENQLNPYSAKELLLSKIKDVIETNVVQPGAGTNRESQNQEGNVSFIDISSAKTQIEADDIIYLHLMKKGVMRGSAAFREQQAAIRKENNVDKLPMR